MSHFQIKWFVSISILLLSTSPRAAWATAVTIVNPGFEDISGESPFNEFTFGELNGWELYDPMIVTDDGDGPTYFIGTLTPFESDPIGNPGVFVFFPDGAAEGQRVGIAFNYSGSAGQGEYGLFQELDDALQPYTTYTLDVDIGNIDSGTAIDGSFFPLQGFPGYRVELLAGDMVLEQDNNSLTAAIPDGQFATSTVTFSTGASHDLLGQSLGVRLINLNQLDPAFPISDLEVDFDNVRLDASPALPGDFDFNGRVDGSDFLQWQRQADNNPSSAADLVAWQQNFGAIAPAAATVLIPEPTTFLILSIAMMTCLSMASSSGCLASRRRALATSRHRGFFPIR